MKNCFILFIAILGHQSGNVKTECIDNNGRTVQEGKTYIPGPDICTRCVCDNSVAKWCHPVLCTAPQDCKSYTTVGNICCEFNCLDETLKGDNINARSIASTVTAFLFFILIVFLINRLHKRNIMSNGEVFTDPNSLQMGEGVRGIGFISGYMNLPRPDLYYGDHATLHIPLWKTYYPRGDAPPPYDEAIALPHQIVPQQLNALVDEVTAYHRTIPFNMTEIEQNDQPQASCNPETEPTTNQQFLEDNQMDNDLYQCHDKIPTISNDDFREECENCKHDQELAEGYDDIFPEPETMTLERRPQLLTHEHAAVGIESRSSMTLPDNGRLRRPHVGNLKDKYRDGWFKETSLKENSTSDDDQP
ncbi:uncharacterized protein LOC111038280 [Myzus persicae]|uniref:uncharacterized protein LOC111038280 n=1 Tax=Myzus persicae TaxID=13164 RepID=UPI000B9366DE|nr:uncharacterized protein LOC111038280 [Myzus persicae]